MSKKIMKNNPQNTPQITLQNDSLAVMDENVDSLTGWMELFFQYEVTSRESSQKEQRRDLCFFLDYLKKETGHDRRIDWTPRLSASFKSHLQKHITENGRRRWNDRTINRILAHLKTFSKWIHLHRPFPLGNPMRKIKAIKTTSLLDIERAILPSERRRILDACDLLVETGGRSRDRNRFRGSDRPRRKGFRPYRNRAIVYTLIETGMRRAGVTKITLEDVDFENRRIRTGEKGGAEHIYSISREGIQAIREYLEQERGLDANYFRESFALFLPSCTTQNTSGQLHPNAINDIWKSVCKTAEVSGKTPHSARHAMGRHIIEKTGNISVVQRQLGHKNAVYSMQYSRITSRELNKVLDDRE